MPEIHHTANSQCYRSDMEKLSCCFNWLKVTFTKLFMCDAGETIPLAMLLAYELLLVKFYVSYVSLTVQQTKPAVWKNNLCSFKHLWINMCTSPRENVSTQLFLGRVLLVPPSFNRCVFVSLQIVQHQTVKYEIVPLSPLSKHRISK